MVCFHCQSDCLFKCLRHLRKTLCTCFKGHFQRTNRRGNSASNENITIAWLESTGWMKWWADGRKPRQHWPVVFCVSGLQGCEPAALCPAAVVHTMMGCFFKPWANASTPKLVPSSHLVTGMSKVPKKKETWVEQCCLSLRWPAERIHAWLWI